MNTPEPTLFLQRHQQARLALLHSAAQAASARSVRRALHQLTAWTDTLLVHLWRMHQLHRHPMALVAVGGLGRRELYPYSDIDVLVLLPDNADAALAEHAATFIRACWDAGLDIGSSVRTISQCQQAAETDNTIQTALLERRLLAGDATLYRQLDRAYSSTLHPYAFYRTKLLEMRQRHARFNHTPYALEPDCKESPGGLRDLHTVLWIAQAAGYGDNWQALARQGLMTRYELRRMRRHHALLRLVRLQLHLCAQRRENRLLFDLQTQIAQVFQQKNLWPRTNTPSGQALPLRPAEMLMRNYYKAAKGISQLTTILLLNLAERLRTGGHIPTRAPEQTIDNQQTQATSAPTLVGNTASAKTDYWAAFRSSSPKPINARFFNNQGLIDVASDTLYNEQPSAILETFLLYQQTGMHGLSARTLRALYNARPVMNAAFRANPTHRQQFMHILQAQQGVTHALRLMNQTSVLGCYLPPFRRIVGQMQHDLFHAYTVDQHTLMVVRNIRHFFNPEHAHEHPLCAQLATSWQEPWVLVAAALFHDIAKGRGGDHSVLGEQDMRRFAKQHGIAPATTELLAFLVREHLSLSQCAQKQDLGDPAVIARFADLVQNEQRLTALYLLTVADIRATAPWVWSQWKARLLEDLYRLTLKALGGHLPSQKEQVQTRCKQALLVMASPAITEADSQKLWQTLGDRYFLQHDARTIAWHAEQLLPRKNAPQTVVKARPAPQGGGLEVLIYTPDQPALFARICGYFFQAGFSILDAKIHTTTDGQALDTLQITRPHWSDSGQADIRAIEKELALAIEQASAVQAPQPVRLSRRARSFPLQPHILLEAQEHGTNWLLTIHATDRPGLLYLITRVLANQGINVHLAKISTMGERAEDSFLITGEALASASQRNLLEQQLFEAITAAAPNALFWPLPQ